MNQNCETVLLFFPFIIFKVAYDFEKFKIDKAKVCLSVCASVCLSLAIDSSEAIEIIIIKVGIVSASDMVMHHVLIILTLTFIQGHRDLNHE